MKLAYFDDFRLGAVKGDAIIDLTPLLTSLPHRDTQDLMPALIADFAAHRARLQAHVATAAGVPLSGVRLRAPLPRATDRLHGDELHGKRHAAEAAGDQRLP